MRGTKIGGTAASGLDFCVRVVGGHHVGVLHEILNVLHAEGVDVLECRAEEVHDDDTGELVDMDTFIVRSRGKQKDFDDEKLDDMCHHLQELVGEEAQVHFEAVPDIEEIVKATRKTASPVVARMEFLVEHTHTDLDAYKEAVEEHSKHEGGSFSRKSRRTAVFSAASCSCRA